MSRLRRTGGALAALLAVAGSAAAQQAPQAGEIPFETYRLENGLRVILSPDRSTPVVAVNVWYDVGSRNERQGRTGFAHLFEHMMFQGSQNVEKGAHMTLIERAGGSMNGTTSEDRTNYFQTLPANRLNLGLWLEADRMRSLDITAENFENQREVVKEERRLRVDNQPYTGSFLRALYQASYNAESCFAYGHDVIGSMDDLNAAELRDVQEFFDTYYAPNNATLTVVGDFDPAEARRLIQEYFADIPSGQAPAPVECGNPFVHLPVSETVPDPRANLPAFISSYGIPEAGHPDSYALTLLGQILGSGESSRLNQRLVKEEQAALQAQASANVRRGPGVFLALGISNQGVEVDRLERLIGEEIEKIRRSGVTQPELDKAKNQYRARTIRGRQTALGRAEALQYFAHFHDDPAAIRTDLERYQAVTQADIQRVANQYLTPQNRAVVIAQPAATGTQE
ncbi:MAG: insulinase family protein [Gemmatimonadetes bacterium]|nr:insulinase family protein [Gemmatimonadota bacterium]